MEKYRVIHLDKPNTLSQYLTEAERQEIVSLKITGFLGQKDFDDVLDDMCDTWGYYDDDDNFIPDFDETAALRHLDMGEATYVDGECLPDFGFHTLLETVILPKGITATQVPGEDALSDAENLRTLVLPQGLESVGGFNHCPKLTDLILPEGLKEIEWNAFSGCESITSIRIPASVEYLSGRSFAACNIAAYEVDENNPHYTVVDGVIYSKDLKTLVAFPSAYPKTRFEVPSGTIQIAESAFCCSKIESIVLPEGITTIKKDAFWSSHIHELVMPDSVKTIGESAFIFCKELESVRISRRLSEIPDHAFFGCPRLKELFVPSNVRKIHYSSLTLNNGIEKLVLEDGVEEIFSKWVSYVNKGSLRELYLPITLKKVPGGVFNYSPNLEIFNLVSDNPYFMMIDKAFCSKDGKRLFSVPSLQADTYTIPEGVEVIKEHAFAFMPKLETIILPSTLRIIECRAFQNVDALKSITIPANVTQVHIDALWADNLKTIIIECTNPPMMTGELREEEWRYKDVKLLVPKGTLSAYKQAPGWNSFKVMEQI